MKYIYLLPLLAALSMAGSLSHAGSAWGDNNRIERIIYLDGLGLVRLLVSGVTNPHNCEAPQYIDFFLDAEGSSDMERQLLMDALHLAFISQKTVRFLVDDERCSEVETSKTIPVGVGVQVLRTSSS